MIPFARISKYGNKSSGIIIKKYYRSALVGVALDSSNGMWYLGYNAYGGSGDGTTTADYSNWKFIRNDVSNYWGNGSYGTSVIKTVDGKIYWCGNNAWLIGASNGTPNTNWSEIAFLSNKDVRNMQVGPNYIIAQVGTQLYAFGVNVGGIFNGTSVVAVGAALSTWTLISSTYVVKDFCSNVSQCFISTTSGVLLGCGTNSFNCLSNASLNSVLQWSTILNGVNISNTASYSFKSLSNASVAYATGVYGRGNGISNQFGNNSTTPLSPQTNLDSFWPGYANINTLSFSGSDNGSAAPNCFYVTSIGSANYLYAMGGQSYGELGVGDQLNKSTPVLVPLTLDENESIIAIVHSNSNCTTLYTNKRVLNCGRSFNGTAYYNTLTFTKDTIIPSSWTFAFDVGVKPWY